MDAWTGQGKEKGASADRKIQGELYGHTVT